MWLLNWFWTQVLLHVYFKLSKRKFVRRNYKSYKNSNISSILLKFGRITWSLVCSYWLLVIWVNSEREKEKTKWVILETKTNNKNIWTVLRQLSGSVQKHRWQTCYMAVNSVVLFQTDTFSLHSFFLFFYFHSSNLFARITEQYNGLNQTCFVVWLYSVDFNEWLGGYCYVFGADLILEEKS